MIYSVIVTDFLDDYKSRGADWSSTRAQKLFSTREYAEEYLADVLCAELIEHEIDVDTDNVSYDDLCYMANEHLKGEFVPMMLEWSIKELEIDVGIGKRSKKRTRSDEGALSGSKGDGVPFAPRPPSLRGYDNSTAP